MASVIGNLRIALGLDSAQFQAGLAQAQKGMARMAGQAKIAFAAVAAAGAAAGVALAFSVKRTIDEADELGKAAQKFGVGVEELSRLKHAADLSGISLEGLGTGLRKLSQNMVEASQSVSGPAAEAFAALGISVKNADGTLKTSTEVMTEVADRFGRMEDGAAKTALAMEIFGKAGTDLIPMLNAGAGGLAEMVAEADKLGIVITSKTAKAAEAFNDNLTRIGKVKDGLVLTITERLLPSLEWLSERFLQFAADGDRVKAVADGINAVFEWMAKGIATVALTVQRLQVELAAIGKAFQLIGAGEWRAAWDTFMQGQEDSVHLWEEGRKRIENMFAVPSNESIRRGYMGLFGLAGTESGKTFVANFKTELPPISDALKEMAANAMDGLTAMADEAADRVRTVEQQMRQGADYIAGAFESFFDGITKGGKTAFESLRDVAISILEDIARAALRSGIFKLLMGAFGGGGLNSGISMFGAGDFNAAGQLLPGFATGSSFRVPGAGGTDSQMVGFRATPGEIVDIRRPGQGSKPVHVAFAPNINISGANDPQAVGAEVARQLDHFSRFTLVDRVKKIQADPLAKG